LTAETITLFLRRSTQKDPNPECFPARMSSMNVPLKSGNAFTLVELLVAMVIVGIALMGLVSMQISCINSMRNSRGLTGAVILAQDMIEELKSVRPDHPSLADTNPGNNADLSSSIAPPESDHRETPGGGKGEGDESRLDLQQGYYTRVWNVADNTPLLGKKTVVVIITWNSGLKKVAVASVI